MQHTQVKKTIGICCLKCGQKLIQEVNFFQVAGNKLKLTCTNCGETVAEIRSTLKDATFFAPCRACGKFHTYDRKLNNLFNPDEDVFRFMCTASGLETMFIGQRDRILPALRQADKDYINKIDEFERENNVPENERFATRVQRQIQITKSSITQFLIFSAEDGTIFCRCHGMEKAENTETVKTETGVELRCLDCGRKLVIDYDDYHLLKKLTETHRVEIDD